MRKRDDVQKPAGKPKSVPATIGQIIDLVVTIIQSILRDLTGVEVQLLLSSKGRITNGIRKLFREILGEASVTTNGVSDLRIKWHAFYHTHFNLDLDFSNLPIPEKPADGNWTLVIVLMELTLNQIFNHLMSLFGCWRYTEDLDANIKDTAKRTWTKLPCGNQACAVWIEADKEAPAKYANKSANDLAAEKHQGVTVKEQLLLQLDYFDTHKDEVEERDRHMDSENITRCYGSRYSDGGVPCVYWCAGYRGLCVYWFGAGSRDDRLRSRSAVTL